MTTFKRYRVSVGMPDDYEPLVFGVSVPEDLEDDIRARMLAMRDGALSAGYPAEVILTTDDVEVVT